MVFETAILKMANILKVWYFIKHGQIGHESQLCTLYAGHIISRSMGKVLGKSVTSKQFVLIILLLVHKIDK